MNATINIKRARQRQMTNDEKSEPVQQNCGIWPLKAPRSHLQLAPAIGVIGSFVTFRFKKY